MPAPMFHLENPQDRENTLTVVVTGAGIEITVSDEDAVDSYNDKCELSFRMTREQAIAFRVWVIDNIRSP